MDRIGLLNNLLDSETAIAQGRRWMDTDGMEREGRLSYQYGLAQALEAFQQVNTLTEEDMELVILAEYTYIAQELYLCDVADTQTTSSLNNALKSLDDALLSLEAIKSFEAYKGAEMTHPHSSKYRIKDMPKDAFHIMVIAHRMRITNILRSPGINLSEKKLLAQRLANINAVQAVYLEKQQQMVEAILADQKE